MLLKQGKIPSVCFWQHPDRDSFINELPVRDVWGIGRQWSTKLNSRGIHTAGDLSKANPETIRKSFNIVMAKTVMELKGTSCIAMELIAPVRQSLVRSRMFSRKINDPKFIKQAIMSHLARATEKLRKYRLMAGRLSIPMTTGRHVAIRNYASASQLLIRPTNDTFVLSDIAERLFDECYKSGDKYGNQYQYSKAGGVSFRVCKC